MHNTGGTDAYNLKATLKRSMADLDDESRPLLAVSVMLPAGLAMRDAASFVSGNSIAAANRLRALGLAELHGDRLCVPEPARTQIVEMRPLSPEELEHVASHYFQLVEEFGCRIGRRGGSTAAALLEPEIDNIIRLVELRLSHAGFGITAQFCDGIGRVLHYTCRGNPAVLMKLAVAAERAGYTLQQGRLLLSSAKVMSRKSSFTVALEQFDAARVLLVAVEDFEGEADCHIGTALCYAAIRERESYRSAIDAALEIYTRIENGRGIAKCEIELARLDALSRSFASANVRLDQAIETAKDLDEVWLLANADAVRAAIYTVKNDEPGSIELNKRARACFQDVGDAHQTAFITYKLANSACKFGQYDKARDLATTALRSFERMECKSGCADCLLQLGQIDVRQKRYSKSLPHFEDASGNYGSTGQRTLQRQCQQRSSAAALAAAEVAAAQETYPRQYERYLALLPQIESTGSSTTHALCLHKLGNIANMLDKIDVATGHFESAEKLYRSAGNEVQEAVCLERLALLASRSRRAPEARQKYELARSVFNRAGKPGLEANCIRGIAHLQVKASNFNEAESLFKQSQFLSRQAEDTIGEGNSALGLGAIARKRYQYQRAAELYEQALDLYTQAEAHFSMGIAHRFLATVADSRTKFNHHIDAARDLLNSVGCDSAVQALDKLRPMRRANPALSGWVRFISKVLRVIDH